ncbi:MAG: hypothetical protein ACI4M3_09290 [Acutalibacteraceae bacterium]
MNQEKIMKVKMITAIVLSILAIVAMCVFIALYFDKTDKTRHTFKEKYMENLTYACEEIDTYLDSKIDLELHYNMILSDVGAARTLIFLIDDYSAEKQKTINTFHYCLVKYPDQMKEKLKESRTAMDDITANLDKGYDELEKIIDSIDKLGT